MITQEQLKDILYYDNGVLRWKKTLSNGIQKDSIAGNVKTDGYYQLKYKNKHYYIHRLVFLYHHGYLPKFIDHVDCDKANNKIENLREATPEQNHANRKLQKNNTSGVKNVHWSKQKQKWHAVIDKNKKSVHIGYFDTIDDATEAVKNKRIALHKEFARHE